jgi:acetate kinase
MGVTVRVLVINCGSSTLKFRVVEVAESKGGYRTGGWLVDGIVERVGHAGAIRLTVRDNGEEQTEGVETSSHADAMGHVLEKLDSIGYLGQLAVQAVGHRVVHGGQRFTRPTLINSDVIADIDALSELAPLHNGPSVEAIRSAWESLGTITPMVATFDTLFHGSLPPRASLYPIPGELAEKHQIKRYGAHGLAHRYMVERYAEITATPVESVDLITLQLGSGCSAAAIRAGHSVDTSMGLTPLEGLMMGTRTGDVDPSLAGYLARREGVETEVVEDWLNKRSGLLGVSGISQDVRDLLEAEQKGNERAALAIDMFCYRVRKYIGAYLAALGGADAVVFGGGIGEKSPAIRERICAGMEWSGLVLDPRLNSATIGTEGRISVKDAGIHAYVVAVDEAAIIARETAECVHRELG